jgi:hypothetical protein
MNSGRHLAWIVAGTGVGFVTSSVFGDLLTLPVDLYYLIYFGIITVFFSIYIKKTQLNLKEWFSQRVLWGILLGVVFGGVMMLNVLTRPETGKIMGPYLAWSIFWRGLVYGTIDGLFLSVFPWIVTWRALNVREKPLGKKIAFGLLAWLFIMVISTGYHLGYSDFRSRKVIQADIGNTIISIPTLVSSSPIGSPITHAIMHITAVVCSPDTELFIPPHRD